MFHLLRSQTASRLNVLLVAAAFTTLTTFAAILSSCAPPAQPAPNEPQAIFEVKGSIAGDVASLPPDTRVAVLWANPAGIPDDYTYVAGLGTIDRTAKTFAVRFTTLPPDSAWIMLPVFDTTRSSGPTGRPALLRRDSTWKVGIGFIVMVNDAGLQEGILRQSYPLQSRFVGGVNNMAVVYRTGNVPTSSNPRDGFLSWIGAFPNSLSLGKGTKGSAPGFDAFAPAPNEPLTMSITPINGFQVPNWTR
jgi:hypothetical protein